MADNIIGKDGNTPSATVTIATKDAGGVHIPKTMLVDSGLNEIDMQGPALIGGQYNSTRTQRTSGSTSFAELGQYGGQITTAVDDYGGRAFRNFLLNGVYAVVSGSSANGLFSTDVAQTTAAIGLKYDAIKNGWRKDAYPSRSWRLNSSAATDNAATIWTQSGMIVKRMSGFNNRTSVVYIKLYDKATTAPTSSDTPILVYPVGPSSPFNIPLDDFILQNGLGIRIVTDATDGGTTAVASGDILGLMITFST